MLYNRYVQRRVDTRCQEKDVICDALSTRGITFAFFTQFVCPIFIAIFEAVLQSLRGLIAKMKNLS